MNDVGGRVDLHRPAFAEEDDPSPLACGANRGCVRGAVSRTIDRALDAEAAGQFPHLGDVFRTRRQNRIAKAEVYGYLQAFRQHIDSNDFVCAEFAAESARGQPDRTEAGDEHA